jgi:type IV pilus assembly protein PilC
MAATLTYQYSVRNRAGKIVHGKLEAETEAAVVQRLRTMGYAPISISQANAGMQKELSIPGFGGRVKLKDLAVMSRQFATMISSGLSLLRALSILAEQTENKTLRETLREVRNDVETGSASRALAASTDVFPPLMVNMIRAGEIGGFLDAVCCRSRRTTRPRSSCAARSSPR